MRNLSLELRKWLPSLLMMGLIFWFSSQPSSNLPDFNWADRIVKKGGHIFGYGLLAWGNWSALVGKPNRHWLAWLLAILYAVTDEFHQSFVAGRFASIWDVVVFDNLGAVVAIWLLRQITKNAVAKSGRTI